MKRDAKYILFPNLSPYSKTDRFEDPKEDHKYLAEKFGELVDVNREIKVCDLGCGSGEFLYYLHKLFPHWRLFS